MIAARNHQRFAVVHDDVAEAENVGANDRRLARHRFEQRDAERRLRRWAGVHGAVRVVARTSLEHGADEDDVADRRSALLVVVLAQWTVADDDELRLSRCGALARDGTSRSAS